MPIKFRCPHCQQFLGISRARAGAVTDCPMCGRSIRVPLLDGSIEPLPAPELNLQDHGLASALDKLANLAVDSEEEADEDLEDSRENAHAARLAKPLAPFPLPEPVELQPSPAPLAVAVEPAPVRTASAGPAAVEAAPRRRSADVLDELAALSSVTSMSPRGGSFRWIPWAVAAVIGIASFLAGYALGRSSRTAPAVAHGADDAPRSDVKPAAPPQQAIPQVAAGPALTGRISYVDSSGEVRPDSGARVLVLPEERSGTSRLAADGFRSGADEADRQLAIASVRALGGDFATTDEQGNYSIRLPQAGLYQLLILSRYQARPEGAPVDPTALMLLDMYLDRPSQAVGDMAVHVSSFRYRGSGVSTRDQTFEVP